MVDGLVTTAALDRARGVTYDPRWYSEAYFQLHSGGERRHWYYQVAAALGEKLPGVRTALDAGCGIGMMIEAWTAMGIDAHGIDVSPSAIALAQPALAPRLQLCDASRERLPFLDGEFDLATSIEVVEHLPEHDHLARELARVIRPGGWLFVQTPKPGTAAAEDPTHISLKAKREWVRLFEAAGFARRDDLFATFEQWLPLGMLGRKLGWIRETKPVKRYLLETGTRTLYQRL